MSKSFDPTSIQATISCAGQSYSYFSLKAIEDVGLGQVARLPFSIKVLLESAVRNYDDYQVRLKDIQCLAGWSADNSTNQEIAFKPGRVILQDFTGVPCVVDLAAMRSALKKMGGDHTKINPQVMCDLVIDHSVQVDYFRSKDALTRNVTKEFERNRERYEFLRWGQNSFRNFRVVPPATGIVHQVNLEYLSRGVLTKKVGEKTIVFPDSLVGTDSHTTMINGLGVVGWGVGGIEAEAVMLGEPIYMLMPPVVGFRLTGRLAEGVTATDLVLTVTAILRRKGVVGKFVEFFGNGLSNLSLPDRATISNMAPEYGATIGLFPVDEETLRYYAMTGRSRDEIELIKAYMQAQGMFYAPGQEDPTFSDVVELDLSSVEPSLAGPKRPQDRIPLKKMKDEFRQSLNKPVEERGFGLKQEELNNKGYVENGQKQTIGHGAVVIAAITSCTNTSNPSVMVGAGLLAKKAVERGLSVPSFVKTSLAPGSRVVTEYLNQSGLDEYLNALGFQTVGYGCTTCIGNSGPLPANVAKAIQDGHLVAASVLSGNRNFEGRINPLTKANYLASPPLVVAYALAGRVDVDFDTEPLGRDKDGQGVYLKDIWPSQQEIADIVKRIITPEMFSSQYKDVFSGNQEWSKIRVTESDLYAWDRKSTYIQEPPFFEGLGEKERAIRDITGARVLVKVGDSITTDHISPAGAIAPDSPAGQYLQEQGVQPKDFNSYGSRRGNDRVMTRGTFANIRLRNQLVPGSEGSWTKHFPDGKEMNIYAASCCYKKDGVPLVVLAGKEYGTGSSRDWAAKGTALLGVQVVLAESFERIHRSNLVGMGVLPLEFVDDQNADTLGLSGTEEYAFLGLSDNLNPGQRIKVQAKGKTGTTKEFEAVVRLDTQVEIDYYRNGGILHTVLLKLAGIA